MAFYNAWGIFNPKKKKDVKPAVSFLLNQKCDQFLTPNGGYSIKRHSRLDCTTKDIHGRDYTKHIHDLIALNTFMT